MRPPLSFAIGVVRLWTRIYTAGLPAEWAGRRRLEIDSDLWELQSDPQPRLMPSIQVIARLLTGVPDDLQWRVEHAVLEDSVALRRTITIGGTATLMCILLWVSSVAAGGTVTGHRGVVECAERQPRPETNEAYRLQVIDCAGAFFGGIEVNARDAILHELKSR